VLLGLSAPSGADLGAASVGRDHPRRRQPAARDLPRPGAAPLTQVDADAVLREAVRRWVAGGRRPPRPRWRAGVLSRHAREHGPGPAVGRSIRLGPRRRGAGAGRPAPSPSRGGSTMLSVLVHDWRTCSASTTASTSSGTLLAAGRARTSRSCWPSGPASARRSTSRVTARAVVPEDAPGQAPLHSVRARRSSGRHRSDRAGGGAVDLVRPLRAVLALLRARRDADRPLATTSRRVSPRRVTDLREWTGARTPPGPGDGRPRGHGVLARRGAARPAPRPLPGSVECAATVGSPARVRAGLPRHPRAGRRRGPLPPRPTPRRRQARPPRPRDRPATRRRTPPTMPPRRVSASAPRWSTCAATPQRIGCDELAVQEQIVDGVRGPADGRSGRRGGAGPAGGAAGRGAAARRALGPGDDLVAALGAAADGGVVRLGPVASS
jgi:hypothetical protein